MSVDPKRRDLFTGGMVAIGGSLLPRTALTQAPAGTDYPLGNFIVRRIQGGLLVLHQRGGDRVIWEPRREAISLARKRRPPRSRKLARPKARLR